MMFGGMLSINTVSAATSLTLTSSGSQSIDVSPATGTAISSDAINVTTTCRYGYNFTIQTSVDDTTLYLDGNSDSSAYTYFSPAGGFDPLNETENEWGYFYDGNTVPTNASIFSPVPSSLEEPAIIKAPLDSPASSDINDNFNIYYGVSVSANAEKGTYKMIPDEHDNDGTIVYIATAADACSRYTVHFDPTSTATGSSVTGTGTMNDQTILEGVATTLTSNGFTAPSGYYFAGWNTARDGSGIAYYDRQEVTDLVNAGSTITLYAQWTTCPEGRICYRPNANDVTGDMIESVPHDHLIVNNFARPGYGFAGWSINQAGTGRIYGPNEAVSEIGSYLQHNPGGYDLYANWVENTDEMQNWDGCADMDVGDLTALEDIRDNNVYTVAKLADGKCWMIENLRLDDSSEITVGNTNNPLLPMVNDPINNISSNYLSPSTTVDSICEASSSSVDCIDHSMFNNDNTTLYEYSSIPDEGSQELSPWDFIKRPLYGYGNYYNWYSATAAHGTYDTLYTGSDWERQSVNVVGDLCPAGWRLPTETFSFGNLNIGDFTSLLDSLGDVSNLTQYPNNYVFNGIKDWSVEIPAYEYRGYNMYYWTATSYPWNNELAIALEFSGGLNTESKAHGLGVRCISNP